MSKQDWAKLLVILLGIYLILTGLVHVFIYVATPFESLWSFTFLIPNLLYVAAGLFLILFCENLSYLIFPQREHPNESDDSLILNRDTLMEVLLVSIGILILALKLPALPGSITYLLIGSGSPYAFTHRVCNLVGEVATLAIGIYLILGTRGLIKVIHHLRSFPHSPESSTPTPPDRAPES